MIERGANPHILDSGGNTAISLWGLDNLPNLPDQRSVYFTIRPIFGDARQRNDFQAPWFYQTGVFNGYCQSLIGKGASGTVLRGEWYGKNAAFKFVEVKDQKWQVTTEKALKTLDETLSEMITIQATKGSKIVSLYGHYRLVDFLQMIQMNLINRQQLHIHDDENLAKLLEFQNDEVRKYDVFVFELCDGNISKEADNGFAGCSLSSSQAISICNQLLQGLVQLEKSKSCHNDLKPENVLFNAHENGKLQIKISDFGQAGRTGGTPGWTWPKFLTDREPGKSDAYSVALLMLYVMSDD